MTCTCPCECGSPYSTEHVTLRIDHFHDRSVTEYNTYHCDFDKTEHVSQWIDPYMTPQNMCHTHCVLIGLRQLGFRRRCRPPRLHCRCPKTPLATTHRRCRSIPGTHLQHLLRRGDCACLPRRPPRRTHSRRRHPLFHLALLASPGRLIGGCMGLPASRRRSCCLAGYERWCVGA